MNKTNAALILNLWPFYIKRIKTQSIYVNYLDINVALLRFRHFEIDTKYKA